MKDKSNLWQEIKDSEGNSSYMEFDPVKITDYENCEHEFVYDNNRTVARCPKCGFITPIVFGIQKIEDGKIVPFTH
jgi:ribosomal protein S27E